MKKKKKVEQYLKNNKLDLEIVIDEYSGYVYKNYWKYGYAVFIKRRYRRNNIRYIFYTMEKIKIVVCYTHKCDFEKESKFDKLNFQKKNE